MKCYRLSYVSMVTEKSQPHSGTVSASHDVHFIKNLAEITLHVDADKLTLEFLGVFANLVEAFLPESTGVFGRLSLAGG